MTISHMKPEISSGDLPYAVGDVFFDFSDNSMFVIEDLDEEDVCIHLFRIEDIGPVFMSYGLFANFLKSKV